MENRTNSLKTVRPFDEIRESNSRTNPDYVENKIEQLAHAYLSLSDRRTLIDGMDARDSNDLSNFLHSLLSFKPITELLDEADRCIKLANSPNGAVAVTGKALDLLINSFSPKLKGPLGSKLHELKNGRGRNDVSQEIRNDLIRNIKFLEIRNAGAHFITSKPELSAKEAQFFLDQMRLLIKYEEGQATVIFKMLKNNKRCSPHQSR